MGNNPSNSGSDEDTHERSLFVDAVVSPVEIKIEQRESSGSSPRTLRAVVPSPTRSRSSETSNGPQPQELENMRGSSSSVGGIQPIALEICENLATERGAIKETELKMLGTHLSDSSLTVDQSVTEMRGLTAKQLAGYIIKYFHHSWIRVLHNFMGLGSRLAHFEPGEPGRYKVVYKGGIRFRKTADMKDLADKANAELGDSFVVAWLPRSLDQQEFASIFKSFPPLALPVRFADGESLLERCGPLPAQLANSLRCCKEIVNHYANGQSTLQDQELRDVVKHLDPTLMHTAVAEIVADDERVEQLRSKSLGELPQYMAHQYPSSFIRILHNLLGLNMRDSLGSSGFEPGVYEVTYKGGVRYRNSANMQDTADEIAKAGVKYNLVRFVTSDKIEFGFLYETKQEPNGQTRIVTGKCIPTRLNSGEALMKRTGELPSDIQAMLDAQELLEDEDAAQGESESMEAALAAEDPELARALEQAGEYEAMQCSTDDELAMQKDALLARAEEDAEAKATLIADLERVERQFVTAKYKLIPFMKMKRHLLKHGVEKEEIDHCLGKYELFKLSETRGLELPDH